MQVPKKMRIAPSILSADLARLGAEVDAVVEAGADLIHFDVMDNHYVPNLTFGPPICQSLVKYGVDVPLDVHLMAEPVDDLIRAFADAGVSHISFHPEATRHVDRSMQLVKDLGCEVGLVLNPATPLALIEPVLHEVDMLLIMSVNPGFGGQKFIPYVMHKIREARTLIDQKGCQTRVEVDGGIKIDNVSAVAQAGADTFVMGSAIFGEQDYRSTLARIREQLPQ